MTMPCRGASLVELLMAMGVTAATACAMLSMVVAGQSLARIQPEQADQQQRARVTAQVIGAELARAGAGSIAAAAPAVWRGTFHPSPFRPTAG